MHIVEELISERAPKLVGRPALFKLLRPMLYRMLAYDAAVFLTDAIKNKTGHHAFKLMTKHINPRISVQNLDRLPKTGKCILISNHPTGLADGIAVYQSIKERRPDHIFLANSDALRVMPLATDLFIPVEWKKEKRSTKKTRRTLFLLKQALKENKCIIIFPSGRLAKFTCRGLIDRKWESSAAMLARKYQTQVVPLKIEARNSFLYYLFAWISRELRDITLFNELLNKKGKTFKLTFGEPITSENLSKNAVEATQKIRSEVESL